MSIREQYPPFVATEKQIQYYKALFDDLEANDIPMQTQDRFSLGMLAINMCLIEEYASDIAENGATMDVTGDRGVPITKSNPAVNALKDAQNMVAKLLKEFKMTPTSRGAKVASGKMDKEPDAFDSFLKNTRAKK